MECFGIRGVKKGGVLKMFVKDIMQKKLITVSSETTIREAAGKMRSGGIGCVLVTSGEERLEGFVTDRDIACWLAEGENPDTTKVKAIMKTKVITTTPEADVLEAERLMAKNKVRRLPVVENGRLRGIVTTADIAPVLEEEINNFLRLEGAYRH
jgi:CBS domain-containing protein